LSSFSGFVQVPYESSNAKCIIAAVSSSFWFYFFSLYLSLLAFHAVRIWFGQPRSLCNIKALYKIAASLQPNKAARRKRAQSCCKFAGLGTVGGHGPWLCSPVVKVPEEAEIEKNIF